MEPRRVYEHLRQIAGKPVQRRGRRKVNDTPTDNMPFAPGRDPRVLSESLSALATTLGWTGPLAQQDLLAQWGSLVGDDIAQHCTPVGIEGGILQVRCASTSWATQLTLMRTDLLTIIITRFPDAEITSIHFRGPDAPTWKRGLRSVPGRGPRDTYG
ncbi:MAG: hypothetical protein B5766_06345 [Candidatus Lumbricidophila eiseniae]|uniref:RNA-binding protein n=1 Tax=Candidatus Lumbricidiphila eiseniae TaxID=1969409 RepID=A0A2A6FRU2_9MICO|nr:MAG: hypothetical protein B5766_06345 [Candidatus Lumbricidophila eiseniae]